jgi:hypothetical protein
MILSNVSVPMLGMVDTGVMGHLENASYLGAVAVGATIFGFLYMGFNFLRMGTTGIGFVSSAPTPRSRSKLASISRFESGAPRQRWRILR